MSDSTTPATAALLCRCKFRPYTTCDNRAIQEDGLCDPCRRDGGDGHPKAAAQRWPASTLPGAPAYFYVKADPYLRREDGSLIMCANHPTEEAMALTEYANTGWRAECDDCYEVNYDANT